MLEICPSCGGNKMRSLGNNVYECEYCKQTFQEVQGPPPPPQNPQQVTYEEEAEEEYDEEETPLSERPIALFCVIIGWGCIIFGIVDFCGNFGHYDLTGVPWSPIVAGVIGAFFKDYLGKKLDC